MAGIGGIYVFWALYFLAAVVCQILTGDFPSAFFAFPVNAAFMLLWMAVLWVLFREKKTAVLFVGHMSELADSVRKKLKEDGLPCSLVNARFVKPLDTETLDGLLRDHSLFVTIEENVLTGGYGEQVLRYLSGKKETARVLNFGISDDYVEHGNVDVLRREVGLDWESIAAEAVKEYQAIKRKDR